MILVVMLAVHVALVLYEFRLLLKSSGQSAQLCEIQGGNGENNDNDGDER